MKTQHQYANIREFAMKTLATLILEDYLKFRGTLLIYILAGMLDQQREIKELATELIMKYTLEKNNIFLRTCLLECPFVFNGCPCFGQSSSTVSPSGNILKGAAKRSAREFIYRYLIRKVETVYLYMYFGNIVRLLDHIEKEKSLAESIDMQAAIADFLYVCTEICIANEKQKKNLSKIVKDNQNSDGTGLEENEITATTSNEPETEPDADESGKGRRGKKNQPTIAQSLVTVEKIVPLIATIDEKLRPMDPVMYGPVIDRLCNEMCIHFEALLEYGQPRKFWAKYLKNPNKVVLVPATLKKLTKHTARKSSNIDHSPSTSQQSKSRKDEENDSGQFTIEEIGDGSSILSKITTPSTSTKRSTISTPSTRTKSPRASKSKKRNYKSDSSSGRGDDDNSDDSFSDDASSLSSGAVRHHKKSSTVSSLKKQKPTVIKSPASTKSTRHR